eukprot:TRINITY_DN94577_c0_g1_i1.p1 TRINITY_DN94577_c0_g1~~TRINITY_DN94577_c0_g1_i1.p1  ORF type:complete len:242 (-),score=26.89 TRINITY_DN94577_c0_g1_i1:17-676(-)
MELLRIQPVVEWEDSDFEDVGIGACALTGTSVFNLEAGDLSDESDGSGEMASELSAACSWNAANNHAEITSSNSFGINIFDLNAACWKHWQRHVAEREAQHSARPKQCGGGDNQVQHSFLESICQERDHHKLCAAFWTSQDGVSVCRKGDSCSFNHADHRQQGVSAQKKAGRSKKKRRHAQHELPTRVSTDSPTASTSSTQASFGSPGQLQETRCEFHL